MNDSILQQIVTQLRPNYPFREGCRVAGFSPATGYRLAKAGKLRIVKIGGRSTLTGPEIARIIADGASLANSNAA